MAEGVTGSAVNKETMYKDFKTKNGRGVLIFSKTIMGLGLHIDLIPAIADRNKKFTLILDLLFIRFWWNQYETN